MELTCSTGGDRLPKTGTITSNLRHIVNILASIQGYDVQARECQFKCSRLSCMKPWRASELVSMLVSSSTEPKIDRTSGITVLQVR